MKRYIHIKKEDREFIAKVFGITERMVFKAIGYESNTELAKKVRKLAKERGGIIMREVPELELCSTPMAISASIYQEVCCLKFTRLKTGATCTKRGKRRGVLKM